MKLLVIDANIFIDLDVCGLIRAMFQLPEQFAVPNVLYEEEMIDQHAELPGYGLKIKDVQEAFVLEAYRLGGIYMKPSYNDLLALSLAKQEQCPLLTGDRHLRSAATEEKVEVRGTIWLVGRLIEEKLISVESAEQAYEEMKAEQRRLPWDLVKQQINQFKNE